LDPADSDDRGTDKALALVEADRQGGVLPAMPEQVAGELGRSRHTADPARERKRRLGLGVLLGGGKAPRRTRRISDRSEEKSAGTILEPSSNSGFMERGRTAHGRGGAPEGDISPSTS
jgi:hypothetical protein